MPIQELASNAAKTADVVERISVKVGGDFSVSSLALGFPPLAFAKSDDHIVIKADSASPSRQFEIVISEKDGRHSFKVNGVGLEAVMNNLGITALDDSKRPEKFLAQLARSLDEKLQRFPESFVPVPDVQQRLEATLPPGPGQWRKAHSPAQALDTLSGFLDEAGADVLARIDRGGNTRVTIWRKDADTVGVRSVLLHTRRDEGGFVEFEVSRTDVTSATDTDKRSQSAGHAVLTLLDSEMKHWNRGDAVDPNLPGFGAG